MGAGRSSYFAIEYLHKKCIENHWKLEVYDASPEQVSEAILALCIVKPLNIQSSASSFIAEQSDIVLSLLPANLHIILARWCVEHNTHFVSSSFVSDEMQELHNQASVKRLVFLNEMGLDPGIDHMSTCQVIDQVHAAGGLVTDVESYCGGLIAEEDCSANPWKYKFAWSPRNVILAGQSGASLFKQNGIMRAVQWHQLFANYTPINLEGIGRFDAYPNRDSLRYLELYHIPHADTLIRGTLRRSGFCKAWHKLVEWGFTDNTTMLNDINSINQLSQTLTGLDFNTATWKNNLEKETTEQIEFLNLGSTQSLDFKHGTPADFLCELLLKLWEMEETDKDEVVLYHKVSYTLNNNKHSKISTLKLQGQNKNQTAMAKLVGLPAAMAIELIAQNKISRVGVQIPNNAEWYIPILANLETEGVSIKHHSK